MAVCRSQPTPESTTITGRVRRTIAFVGDDGADNLADRPWPQLEYF